MIRPDMMVLCAVLAAAPAAADPLADMNGDWRGTGWAREVPGGTEEAVRCRLTNVYDGAAATLTVTGRCAAAGRKIDLSGTMTAEPGTDRLTGRWSNPDGPGSTGISGMVRNDIVAFTFRATDGATGRNLAQNVEWQVAPDKLRLRSTDRTDPDIMMSNIDFTR
ncbi:MAG: hypothetical protein WBA25_04535 [Jannaschia sp.]